MNKRKRKLKSSDDKPVSTLNPAKRTSNARRSSRITERRPPAPKSQPGKGVSAPSRRSTSVDQAQVRTHSSDGMSFDDHSDDEVLPDIDMDSPSKQRNYEKNDIIWAPYKNVFWPAVVTSVNLPNVCYLFINHSNDSVFKKRANLLLPFDNSSRNQELKVLGEKAASHGFKEAYEHVIQYFLKRKQNNKINARRFLTLSNKNDKVEQAKECLLRVTGLDVFGEDDESVTDDCETNSSDKNSVCGEDDIEDETTLVKDSDQEMAVKRILEDLERVPDHMTVSLEQQEVLKNEAKQLLEVIYSKDCCDHLKKIQKGHIKSCYHLKYSQEERLQNGLGPFTLFDDLTTDLLTLIDKHCDKFAPDYKQNVMLPEAVIYAITKVKQCKRREAKRHFNATSKKVGVKDS